MIKIDLITGILGSGKTTFIKEYSKYLLKNNEKICILENDYGAINVDSLLLDELRNLNIDIQMIAGGCDRDCHIRRFKTKLITLSMLGYSRVIVEPSGIFDVDEFFDLLNDDELINKYEIDNVITLVKGNINDLMSEKYRYMLASQLSVAGKVLVTFSSELKDINKFLDLVNSSLKEISSKRVINNEDLIIKDIDKLNDVDFKILNNSKYNEPLFLKKYNLDDELFESIFYMNILQSKDEIINSIKQIWNDNSLGLILRIKGFILENNKWYEINSVSGKININEVNIGQSIIIVIGESLVNDKIDLYFKSEFSSSKTR